MHCSFAKCRSQFVLFDWDSSTKGPSKLSVGRRSKARGRSVIPTFNGTRQHGHTCMQTQFTLGPTKTR